MRGLLIVLLPFLLSGCIRFDFDLCADEPPHPDCVDSGPPRDSGVDAGADSGVDAGTDSGVDAGTDSGVDAGADSGVDAGTDSGVDAGTDSGTNTDAG